MKDLGPLTSFLGLKIDTDASGIFPSQIKYTQDLLKLAGLQDASPVDTPLEVNTKYSREEGELLSDSTLHRQLVGSLNYLTITRPDISFDIQRVGQFMQKPRHLHLAAVRRILRYLRGTLGRGLFFSAGNPLHLVAYSDADWAGCPNTRRSVTEHELAKRQFFEYLQGEAKANLEGLHQCAEKELQNYLGDGTSEDFRGFRTKLAGLTSVTRNYFENLVRALENGLSDVNSIGASRKTTSSKCVAGSQMCQICSQRR
ncbi:hypothetical protein AgCh_000041 [Apium graveolens]